MVIFLYKKIHNKTGKKYLGKTEQDDPFAYSGSGVEWKRHLKEHGDDFSTELVAAVDNLDDFRAAGIFWSRHWDIVESDEWLNLIQETGGGSNNQSTSRRSSRAQIDQINAEYDRRMRPLRELEEDPHFKEVLAAYLGNSSSFIALELARVAAALTIILERQASGIKQLWLNASVNSEDRKVAINATNSFMCEYDLLCRLRKAIHGTTPRKVAA